MPTYDYECPGCNHTFELFQMMSAKPIKKCPECGKNKVKRLIGSGMGIIFKGSGFYETDYKRKENNALSGRSEKANSLSADNQGSKENKSDNSKTDLTQNKSLSEKKNNKVSDEKGKGKK
ncbi:MAG: zinc ribbon domain-containing protein [Candidatus Omnitrophica bacterium]|nr:zinc ribbon domain-containing protein [Candidatus Omnitrophota bacterium]